MASKIIKPEGVLLAIPVRLESERFPNKALVKFNGMSLLEISINTAKNLNFVDKIVIAHSGKVSSKIIKICQEQKVKLLDMLMSMYNEPKYLKGKKSLYLTLNNWINNER